MSKTPKTISLKQIVLFSSNTVVPEQELSSVNKIMTKEFVD